MGVSVEDHRPGRRRDTWLHYATIVALLLQVLVAAFPITTEDQACVSGLLDRMIQRLR